MSDPKLKIKDLLKNNWTAANTSNVTPDFSTGWWDDNNDLPQVTVTSDDEAPLGGGETGQTHLNSDNDQLLAGAVDVNVWANRDSSSENPKKLTYEFKDEVRRIVQANKEAITGFNYIGWNGYLDRTDTNKTPVVYRKLCEIVYGRIE